ncbi:hypothetical protein CLOM_g16944 [Closterium sp. NIES-68]|nr:hypothetical protein CLOM_g16944 [Closterium sp. NIES-68]GJP85339.1 hypothetical protein CLOP_g15443 [Closterium sp. NIES-67]
MCQGERLDGPAASLHLVPLPSSLPHPAAVAAADFFSHLRCDPWTSSSPSPSPSSLLLHPHQLTYHRSDTDAGGNGSCCTISRDDAATTTAAAAAAAAAAGSTGWADAIHAPPLVGPSCELGAELEMDLPAAAAAALASIAAELEGDVCSPRGRKDHQRAAAAFHKVGQRGGTDGQVCGGQAEWPDRLLENWSSRAEGDDSEERCWRKSSPQWGESSFGDILSARRGTCTDTVTGDGRGGGGGGGGDIADFAAENAGGGGASGELLLDAVLAACNLKGAAGRERKPSAEGKGEATQPARFAGATAAACPPANSGAALAVSTAANSADAAATFSGMVPSASEELEACAARREMATLAAGRLPTDYPPHNSGTTNERHSDERGNDLREGARGLARGAPPPFVSSSLAEVAAALERETSGGSSNSRGGGWDGKGDEGIRASSLLLGRGHGVPAPVGAGGAGGAKGGVGKKRRWCDVALMLAGGASGPSGAAAASAAAAVAVAPVAAVADMWGRRNGEQGQQQQQRAASLEDQLEDLMQGCQQQQQQQAERQHQLALAFPMPASAPCVISSSSDSAPPSHHPLHLHPSSSSTCPYPTCPYPYHTAPSLSVPFPSSPLLPCPCSGLCAAAPCCSGALCSPVDAAAGHHRWGQHSSLQQQQQQQQQLLQRQSGQWEGMGRWMSSLTGHAWMGQQQQSLPHCYHLHQHQHQHHHHHHQPQQQLLPQRQQFQQQHQYQHQQQHQRFSLTRPASSYSLTSGSDFYPAPFPLLNGPSLLPMPAHEQLCSPSLFSVPVTSRPAQLPRARTSSAATAAAARLKCGRGRGAAMAAASEKENKRIAAAALQWKQQQQQQQDTFVLPGMPSSVAFPTTPAMSAMPVVPATPVTTGVLRVTATPRIPGSALAAAPRAPSGPSAATAAASAAIPEGVWRINGGRYFPLWDEQNQQKKQQQQQQGARRHKRFKLVSAGSHSDASAMGSVTVVDKLSFEAAPPAAAGVASAAGVAASAAAGGRGGLDLQCTEVM